ncbi:MAG: hypothetical protein JSW30_06100, partial [Dehalococcoidia bacterium]
TVVMGMMVLPLVLLLGCEELGGLGEDLTQPTAKEPKIARSATLEAKWAVNQIELQVAADQEIEILLRLSEQDKVDGYFYIEDGGITDFEISGNSPIYSAREQGALTPEGINSARFSFVATQSQGNTYTLTFSNSGENRKKQTVFLELIYPLDGSLFLPVAAE